MTSDQVGGLMLIALGMMILIWRRKRQNAQARPEMVFIEMIELIEHSTSLHVRNEPPYTQFAHAVDRVIKKRDIIIAVRAAR